LRALQCRHETYLHWSGEGLHLGTPTTRGLLLDAEGQGELFCGGRWRVTSDFRHLKRRWFLTALHDEHVDVRRAAERHLCVRVDEGPAVRRIVVRPDSPEPDTDLVTGTVPVEPIKVAHHCAWSAQEGLAVQDDPALKGDVDQKN